MSFYFIIVSYVLSMKDALNLFKNKETTLLFINLSYTLTPSENI